MLLGKYLNTQFVLHRKHNISITKTAHFMLLTKLTAVYCPSYYVHKSNVCVNEQVLNITAYGLYNMQLLCIKGSNVCLYSAAVCDGLNRQSYIN